MSATLEAPSAGRVKAACEQFQREYELSEQALSELFRQYPGNHDPRHVLLKVIAVNTLHHAMIFDVEAVARHIQEHREEIDAALAAGSPEIVHRIAAISIHGRKYNFFSFATKFCSWHNPEAYPVYDAHVDHYLWTLQKQNHFTSFLHPDLWNYPKFVGVMAAFREFHGLNAFSFKQIDNFLSLEGAPHLQQSSAEEPSGAGAFDFFPGDSLPVQA